MSDVTTELAMEASDKAVQIARLKAENAKLLELVEDMLDCIQIRAAFSRPPTEEMYEMFYKRMRELGVDE